MPDVIEKAGLAVGRGEEPELAVGAGEGGAGGADDIVLDESGFVDDDDVAGVAAAALFGIGDGEDFTTVG